MELSMSSNASKLSPMRMKFSALGVNSSMDPVHNVPSQNQYFDPKQVVRTSSHAREEISKPKPIVSFRSPYLNQSPRLSLPPSKTKQSRNSKSQLTLILTNLIALASGLVPMQVIKSRPMLPPAPSPAGGIRNSTKVKDLHGFKMLEKDAIHPLATPATITFPTNKNYSGGGGGASTTFSSKNPNLSQSFPKSLSLQAI
jgi:hypothetical protein